MEIQYFLILQTLYHSVTICHALQPLTVRLQMCITATGVWQERSSWGCINGPGAKVYGCVWGGNLGWVVLLWAHLLQVTRGFWPLVCTLLTSDLVALQDCSLVLQHYFVHGSAQALIIQTCTQNYTNRVQFLKLLSVQTFHLQSYCSLEMHRKPNCVGNIYLH